MGSRGGLKKRMVNTGKWLGGLGVVILLHIRDVGRKTSAVIVLLVSIFTWILNSAFAPLMT